MAKAAQTLKQLILNILPCAQQNLQDFSVVYNYSHLVCTSSQIQSRFNCNTAIVCLVVFILASLWKHVLAVSFGFFHQTLGPESNDDFLDVMDCYLSVQAMCWTLYTMCHIIGCFCDSRLIV